MNILRKWFTLIELVVTVTVLAVLGTLAFISYTSYISSARDSNRLATVDNILAATELFKTYSWKYPVPTDPVNITYSWAIVWTQWSFWDATARQTGKIFWDITDPLYKNNYTYSVTNSKKEYEFSYILESDPGFISFHTPELGIDTTYAASSFDPLTLNPKIWLHGNDVDGDGDIGNNPPDESILASWIDKSGNGNNPTITTGNIYYDTTSVNGLPSVRVDANSGLRLENSDITQWEIYFVIHDSYSDTNGYALQSTNISGYSIGSFRNWRNTLDINGQPYHLTSAPAVKNTTRGDPFFYSFETDGFNYVFKNSWNIIGWAGTTNSIAGITWGFNQAWYENRWADWGIAEILIFDSVLSDEDSEKVEWYLAHSWLLNGLLPADHPYKNDPPTWSGSSSSSSSTSSSTSSSGGGWFLSSFSSTIENQTKGNYNKLFAHGKNSSDTHFVFTTPSITSTDISSTDFLDIINDKKLVYEWYGNTAATYESFTGTWGFDFFISSPVVFEWTQDELSSYTWLKTINEFVRDTYQNTALYPEVSGYLDTYGTAYVENILSELIGINPIKPYYCSDILDKRFIYNIAPDATITATANTTYGWLSGTGWIANQIISTDGTLDYEYHSDSTNAFMQFEWQTDQPVGFVRIYNRTSCCTSRLSNGSINLYDSSDTLLYTHPIWDTTNDHIIDIDLERIGQMYQNVRKLRIESSGSDSFINLREVEIYAWGNINSWFYLVDSDGSGGRAPYEVYCDMDTDGGGWTQVGENFIDRGNFEWWFEPSNYNLAYDSNNDVVSMQTPLGASNALYQRWGTIGNPVDIEYEMDFSNMIPSLLKGYEIRLSARVADAWDEGTSTNGWLGYIFDNTLTYTDTSTAINGDLETLDTIDVSGKTWKLQRVRIPVEKDVSSFIWSLWYGTEVTNARDMYVTDVKAEVYYK